MNKGFKEFSSPDQKLFEYPIFSEMSRIRDEAIANKEEREFHVQEIVDIIDDLFGFTTKM